MLARCWGWPCSPGCDRILGLDEPVARDASTSLVNSVRTTLVPPQLTNASLTSASLTRAPLTAPR
ncbi:MAG: hypothetical protein H0X17_02455 [Deltaproteobacteria bacterium]|nr:hypothetical protein [Deltaproteobacteria bacterium]